MEKSSNKLVDLSVAFAVEILNLVKHLKKQNIGIRVFQESGRDFGDEAGMDH